MKKPRLQKSDAVWLTAIALLILLQFWWLPGDPGTPDDTYSNTIEGKRGLFQTLQSLEQADLLPPVRREVTRLIPEERSTLVVLSPDRYPDEKEQQALSQFVMNGGTLVFAPNWSNPECQIPVLSIRTESKYFAEEDTVVSGQQTPSPQSAGASGAGGAAPVPQTAEAEDPASTAEQNAGPAGQESSAQSNGAMQGPPSEPNAVRDPQNVIEEAFRKEPGLPPQQSPPLAELKEANNLPQVSDFPTESRLVPGSVPWRTRASMQVDGLSAVRLVNSASGIPQAAAWNYGNGLVLVSASADVFSNRAMLDPAQAELAVRLIEYAHAHHQDIVGQPETPIVISEFLNASDAYRGTAVLMNPSLRAGTLQLITIAVLAGWFGFHRFGPAVRTSLSQRRSLAESAAALGNLHFRTNSGGEAVEGYLEYLKTQLQRLFGRSVHLEDTTAIAARTGLDSDDVRQRITSAVGLAGQSFTTNAQAAAAIRDLSEILNRLHGTGRKKDGR